MRNDKKPRGMTTFTIVWVGQAFSLLSTTMTNFALTIWAFEVTGSATALALVGFFYVTPLLILSPFAGALVDRSNRKLMMMLSDLASGVATLGILILYLTGNLQVWHLYIAALISGAFQTFQWPASSAALTMIVPKQHYARANALTDLAGNTSGIFAPLLAGALLGVVGLAGILIIDLVSLTIAIGALLVVTIPQPKATAEGLQGKGNIWKESIYGFRYIFERRSLLGLQLVFLFGNFFATIGTTLLPPMVLARTMNNSLIFGSVQTAGAVGGVIGGLAMGVWGGPKKRIHGVLTGWALASIFGAVVLGLGRSFPIWAVGSFLLAFFVPLINSSNQTIWQSKVAPDVQGRVFATRRLIAWFVSPLSTLIAGPAADFVMEPAMLPGGMLAGTFDWLVGTGAGSGMALIIIVCGVGSALVGLGGYTIRAIREVETILPDYRTDEQDGRQSLSAEGAIQKGIE